MPTQSRPHEHIPACQGMECKVVLEVQGAFNPIRTLSPLNHLILLCLAYEHKNITRVIITLMLKQVDLRQADAAAHEHPLLAPT